ncbi:hypothetical protein NHP200010_04310 [Helicobacter bizzozeronii]|nr:hypothetical protein NHP200010_04310 [Helicobacter bizzozeronii]
MSWLLQKKQQDDRLAFYINLFEDYLKDRFARSTCYNETSIVANKVSICDAVSGGEVGKS